MSKHRLKTDAIEAGQNTDIGQAVLHLSRCFLQGERFTPDSRLNIEVLWSSLEAHGLGGLAGHLALQGKIDDIRLKEAAEARYMTNLLHNGRVERVVSQITDCCAENLIPVTLLKGPALLKQAYRDQGLRSFGDVDLFFDSRDDILRLLVLQNIEVYNDKGRGSLMQRLRNPGKLDACMNGVDVEMMHLPRLPTDAMQNSLQLHRPFVVPSAEQSINEPDPSFHFVFLILHMLINHFCARLIWFIDLVMLYRERGSAIDWPWVEQELDRLQLRGPASGIIEFCRDSLAATELPQMEPGVEDWNQPFIRYMLQPTTVLSRRLGIQYASGRHKRTLILLNLVGFFLTGEPQGLREASSQATRHMTNRFLNMIDAHWNELAALCRPLCWLLIWPAARLSILAFRQAATKEPMPEPMKNQ
jgi:hypothetical protein